MTQPTQETINERARLALEGLTPGGSEFHNDPDRCVAWLQQLKTDCVEAKKEAVRIRNAHAEVVKALNDFRECVEQGAADVAYKAGLGAGEWEAFIDRHKFFTQWKEAVRVLALLKK